MQEAKALVRMCGTPQARLSLRCSLYQNIVCWPIYVIGYFIVFTSCPDKQIV